MAPKFSKLQGKHVLIIGASSGFGYAVAEGALQAGANLTISSFSPLRLGEAADRLRKDFPSPSQSITAIPCDLSKPTVEADLEALFLAAEARTGTIHHVVYTAADKLTLGGLEGITVELIHKAAHMRMVTPLIVGKVAARHLPRANTSSLTLTSGTVAEKPAKGWAIPAVFSGGIVSLAKSLAVDLAPLRVNVVRAGYVDTGLWSEMSEKDREDLYRQKGEEYLTGSIGQVEDVAEAYLWLMKDSNASGTVAGTDGGALVV